MRRLISVLVCALMLGAAACADTDDDDDTAAGGSGDSEDIAVQGIDGNTVKIVITGKLEACGPSEELASRDVLDDQAKSDLEQYLGFFNEEVLAESGWVLDHEYIDDGGSFCPEKARAAGREIVQEIKPFAVLGPSQNLEQGSIVADMVTAAGIRHIGLSWNVAAELEARAPYAWQIITTAERAMTNLVAYIDKRVKDTPGHDPETREEVDERHYGFVTVDLPEYHDLADVVAEKLDAIGIELEQSYFLSPDPTIAAQNATTVVNRMAEDGINILIFEFLTGAGAFSGGALTQTMAQQNYRPDLLTGSYGLSAIFDPLHEVTVWSNLQGVSTWSPLAMRSALLQTPEGGFEFDPQYANINENATPVEDIWEHLGNETQLGSVPSRHNYYLGMALVAIGLMHHTGDEVTATSWAEGIWSTAPGEENRCTLERFIGGRDTEHTPKYSWTEGDHDGPLDEFTTGYFVPVEPFPGLPGYWESFDNYTYFSDPEELPDEPSHDTAETPPDIPLQDPVGLHPWTTCEEVGLA